MPPLQLYGTPLSHFTRKLRILLAELDVPFDFERVSGVLETTPAAYANNPLMRVPTLVHGDHTLIESDHIARYLVGQYDPGDRFGVRSEQVRDLNRLAVANGIMDNEVVLILAKRGGLEDIDGVTYFRKLTTGIHTGLAWLDADVDDDPHLDYADIAAICMFQHAAHYKLVPLDAYPRLAARVDRFAARPSIASTAP
jgi:glutathione S-transferase